MKLTKTRLAIDMENIKEPIVTRNITVLNRASVKKYALGVSAAKRAGKFTRVGEEFLLRCETRLETELRSLAAELNLPPATDLKLITKLARRKAEEKLDILARQIVYTEVMRHPSIGITLK